MKNDPTKQTLRAAIIYPWDSASKKADEGAVVCHFNPYEYTVSQSNNYSYTPNAKGTNPHVEMKQANPQTLKLSLLFDTYEKREDVTLTTRKLWKFMQPVEIKAENKKIKKTAPFVAFEWGRFRFVSVIQQMSQKFTLFLENGIPVRAKVDVTFQQHMDEDDYKGNIESNPVANQLHEVVGDERLDNVAANVLGAANKWAEIADHNGIDNPFAVQPGQQLQIPGGL